MWSAFLAFLTTLPFAFRGTATLKRSLRSLDKGRLHLHAFMEFKQAMDWTSVKRLRFWQGLPNAAPTKARGDNQRTVKDQGHFYERPNKVVPLHLCAHQRGGPCVATTGGGRGMAPQPPPPLSPIDSSTAKSKSSSRAVGEV